MKKHWIWMVAIFSARVFAVTPSDPLETMLQSEQQKEVGEPQDELPPMFLFGDGSAIKIYSPGTRLGSETWLCRSLELDELVQLTRGHADDLVTDVNLDIPRVRKIFEEACLVRPGDFMMAIGPGEQSAVTIKKFFIKREPVACASDSPYTLWADVEESLESPPFLYSSDLDLPQGSNYFKSVVDMTDSNLTESLKENLSKNIPFLSDFNTRIIQTGLPNPATLVFLTRKVVSDEDDGLPNEALYRLDGDRVEEIWVERVDMKRGSGHVNLQGALDVNGDGLFDLFLMGDHQGCSYKVLLYGSQNGFDAQELPNEPCGC